MPKYIIVGAGPGGLFSARALIKAGIPSTDITILEKESVIGGKCYTYKDPTDHGLKAEYGAAMVAHNYGVVLDAIFEKNITLEAPIPTQLNSVAFVRQFKQYRLGRKIKFAASFAKELMAYAWVVRQYNHIRDNDLPLPCEFELPFFEFAQLKGLSKLNDLLRPVVTGFGYGAMQTCPTFLVIEYIGYTSIAGLLPAFFGKGPFYTVQGGFQGLMEALALDFHVVTHAEITAIDRRNGVHVSYIHQGQAVDIAADYLILAVSPRQWSSLGITQLTSIEKQCIDKLTYYRYPVAICKLKGYPAQQEFFEDSLQPDGFGRLALITTHDNRPNPIDGRLCTAYVNLKPGSTPYDFSRQGNDYNDLIEQLASLPGVTGVELLDTAIWEDYMSFLPWELRCKLGSQQFVENTHTGYVNSCLSFEDVACVARQATQLVSKQFVHQRKKIEKSSLWSDLSRLQLLFYSTLQQPQTHSATTRPLDKTETS